MDEKFFAWLDGELEPTEAAEVERRVAADPELSRLVEKHRSLSRRLHSTFDPIVEAPVLEMLAARSRPSGKVIDLASRRERRRFGSMQQWTAMAASLIVGLMIGSMRSQDGSPVASRDDALYAATDLDELLDTQLASAPAGDTKIGVTFRDSSGSLCRSFSGPSSSGLACRNGKDWQLRGLFAAPEGQAGEFRMASGSDPRLAAMIEEMIAGDPLDANAEAQARARGWR